jgi:hypothetical protein
MSVIGRLDNQVDEIIIKPVGKRKRREGAEGDEMPSQDAATQPQAETEEYRAEDEDKPRDHSSELPVWLL